MGTEPDAQPWERHIRLALAREENEERRRALEPRVRWGDAWRGMLRAAGWLDARLIDETPLYERLVRSLELRAGVVEGTVVASNAKPCRVQVRLPALSESEWVRLARQVVEDGAKGEVVPALRVDALSRSLFAAADKHRLGFLPKGVELLSATCSCGGGRTPCKHVVAIHVGLARKLDERAPTLLELRGCGPAALAALIERVAEELGAQSSALPTLDHDVDPYRALRTEELDWSLLEPDAGWREPLPALANWRARETFDALVQRILAHAERTLED